ncbi:MAG: hypothetical protein K2X29_03535 [Candidatus Obscuribacterales bacterium]|nr:hypothetical protein [Candidatus Obscuribacterales bacterium]
MGRKDNQVNFIADDDVLAFIATLKSGGKSAAINQAVREYMGKRRKAREYADNKQAKQPSELEGWLSWLEFLADPDQGSGDAFAAKIADRITSYYEAMHDSYIGGLESAGLPIPADHRPCRWCGDSV